MLRKWIAQFVLLAALLQAAFATEPKEADVVVYGSTPGGFCAAIAAKRGIAVQDLPYPDLKPRLLAQKQVLALPQGFE